LTCKDQNEKLQKVNISKSKLLNSKEATTIDLLLNVNEISKGLELFHKSKNEISSSTERRYLEYKLNKAIFYQHYFHPCDTLDMVVYDTTQSVFKLLNSYYLDYTFHDEEYIKKSILNVCSQYPDDQVLIAEMYSELGRFYLNEGNKPDSADFYFTKAVEIFDSAKITSYNHYLNVRNLIYLQFPLRKELKALAYMDKLNVINSNLPVDFTFPLVFSSLKAFCLARLGRQTESDTWYKKAFELAGNLKCTYHQQEVYKLYISSKSFQQKKIESSFFENLERLVTRDGNFCNLDKIKGEYILLNEKNPIRAEQYLENAFYYITRSKPFNSLQIYTVMYEMYDCYLENKKYDKAMNVIYSQNIGMIPKGIYTFEVDSIKSNAFLYSSFYFIALESYANVLLKKYQGTKKLSDLTLAASMINLADSVVTRELKTFDEQVLLSLFNNSSLVYHTGAHIFYALYQIKKEQHYLDNYLYFIEKNRDRILYRDRHKNSTASDFDLDTEKLYRQNISKYSTSKQNDSLFHYIKKMEDLYAKKDVKNLNKTIEKNKIPIIKAVKEKIEPNTMYIDASIINDKLYVVYISQNQNGVIRNDMDSLLQFHLSVIRSSQNQYDPNFDVILYQRSAYYVYERLFEDLISNQDKIIYTETSFFSGLNPEALVKSERKILKGYKDLDYLIYNHFFERIESLYLFLEEGKKHVNYRHVTGFFHSDAKTLQKPSKIQIELPGNIIEKEIIELLFKNSQIMSGKNCTKSKFLRTDFSTSDILHISIHGYSLASDKQHLYFLFRNSNTPDTLHGFDLTTVSIMPPLVILTACESGKGRYIPGEGQYSMARYFYQAGSLKVIRSLWNVDDTSGGLIIHMFYTQLKKSNDPTLSLHHSKLNILKSYPNFKHPYFWGGLV
jgi:CHAT domain-containing protein